MSLLTRIARSNGDKVRKAGANLLIAAMDRQIVTTWHHQLEEEIRKKCPAPDGIGWDTPSEQKGKSC